MCDADDIQTLKIVYLRNPSVYDGHAKTTFIGVRVTLFVYLTVNARLTIGGSVATNLCDVMPLRLCIYVVDNLFLILLYIRAKQV